MNSSKMSESAQSLSIFDDTMKLITNFVGFLLLLFCMEYINSDQFMSVFLKRSYGKCNKKYCNVSVKCRPLNRTSKLYSMDVYLRPGFKVEAPIYVEIIGYKKFRTAYRQHMLKLKSELCDQLKNTTNHPYFSRIWKYELKGNVFDPCPITGHRFIKPYVPEYERFPLVPVGEWKVDTIVSKVVNNSEVLIVSYTDYFEVKPTSAVEF